MNGNRYETAVAETESVLTEWLSDSWAQTLNPVLARAIVERLVSKGVIQSTDPDELAPEHRSGPLQPGQRIVGGDEH